MWLNKQKASPKICCLQETHFKFKGTKKYKIKFNFTIQCVNYISLKLENSLSRFDTSIPQTKEIPAALGLVLIITEPTPRLLSLPLYHQQGICGQYLNGKGIESSPWTMKEYHSSRTSCCVWLRPQLYINLSCMYLQLNISFLSYKYIPCALLSKTSVWKSLFQCLFLGNPIK